MSRIRRVLLLSMVALAPALARAVVVRGSVTNALGRPLPGMRVQLVQGQRSILATITGADGSFELRTASGGRFLLLTSAGLGGGQYAPQVGEPFYAGRADSIVRNVALTQTSITPELSAGPTLVETPIAQLTGRTTRIAADELLLPIDITYPLRTVPDVFLLQPGQVGAPAYLYLRGAPPQTLKPIVDGVSAEPLGGALNLVELSTTGFGTVAPQASLELTSGANPVYFVGASNGVFAAHTALAEALRPTLVYTIDGGNLDALRNEAVANVARGRIDLLGAFSRFDISNDTPAARYHLVTYATNDGYHLSAASSLRLTLRDTLYAGPFVSPFEFFAIAPRGRKAAQNLYAAATFETQTAREWHNVFRLGSARKREQSFNYFTPATGLPVTITGANGFSVSGAAAFFPLPGREDSVTNRDELTWQSDYPVNHLLHALGELRVQDERGASILPSQKQSVQRVHFSAAIGLQGHFRQRVLYEASGFVDHTALLGFTGAPRLGLTYVPVMPGIRNLRGTSLHFTAATGNREPSLLEQVASGVAISSPRSRMLSVALDQTLLARKLNLQTTYFHAQFSHEFEPVALSAIASQPLLSQTLALRSQGLELELRYQPYQRVLLVGGYTYLAALVEQSAEPASFSLAFPGIGIGVLSALKGARPFERPPHTGFFLAQYSGTSINASIRGSFSSRYDESTNLLRTPSLLLPNLNLSHGYIALNADISWVATRHLTIFTQFTNLTSSSTLAPIGYVSSPFMARAGLRVRMGGD